MQQSIPWDQPMDTAEPAVGSKGAEEYLRALVRGWWLVLLVAGVLGGAGVAATYYQRPVYSATSRILIEPPRVRVAELGEEATTPAAAANFFSTRVEILSSRQIAERVFNSLELRNWDELRGLEDPVAELSDWLTITPIKNSNLVEVTLEGYDPELIARVVNTTVNEFIRYEHESLREYDQLARSKIDSELTGLEGQLQAATKRLHDFHKTHESFLVTGESVELGRLIALDEAKVQAEIKLDVAKRAVEQFQAWQEAGVPMILPENQKQLLTLHEQVRLVDEELARLKEQYTPQRFDSDARVAQLQQTKQDIEADIAKAGKQDAELELQRLQITVKAAEKDLAHFEDLADKQRKVVLAQQGDQGQLKNYTAEFERLEELRNLIASERAKIELHQGLVSPRIQVVDQAQMPKDPVRPLKLIQIPASIVAGLVLAFAFVMFLEFCNRTIRRPEELVSLLPWPVLALLPKVGRGSLQSWTGRARLASEKPGTPLCEAFRNLRAGVLGGDPESAKRSILVTSPKAGDGKSITALNLASSFAHAGESVLLLEADLRRPVLGKRLKVGRSTTGLVEVLLGDGDWRQAIHETQVPNLSLIVAGATEQASPDILGTVEMYDLLTEAAAKFDRVVIDAPPILGLADARMVARFVDGVLLVVSAGTHTGRTLRRVQEIFIQSGVRVLGTVFSRTTGHHDELTNYSAGKIGRRTRKRTRPANPAIAKAA